MQADRLEPSLQRSAGEVTLGFVMQIPRPIYVHNICWFTFIAKTLFICMLFICRLAPLLVGVVPETFALISVRIQLYSRDSRRCSTHHGRNPLHVSLVLADLQLGKLWVVVAASLRQALQKGPSRLGLWRGLCSALVASRQGVMWQLWEEGLSPA